MAVKLNTHTHTHTHTHKEGTKTKKADEMRSKSDASLIPEGRPWRKGFVEHMVSKSGKPGEVIDGDSEDRDCDEVLYLQFFGSSVFRLISGHGHRPVTAGVSWNYEQWELDGEVDNLWSAARKESVDGAERGPAESGRAFQSTTVWGKYEYL